MLQKFYLSQMVMLLVLAACNSSARLTSMPTATTALLVVTTISGLPTETAVPIPSTPTLTRPTETAVPVPPTPVPDETDDAEALNHTQLTEGITDTAEVAISNFPSVNCCKGRTVQAGSYRLPAWLNLPLSVKVGGGWRVMNEEQAKLFTLARGQNSLNNPSEWITFMNASSAGSSEGLIAQLLEEPNIVPLGEPTVADLAGYAGWQQDFAVLPNPDFAGNQRDDIPAGVQFIGVVEQFFAPGFFWVSSSPEAYLRLVVVNVGDTLLFVYLEAPTDTFATFVADAHQILKTLELLEP
jgi:hypothetical protein